MNNLSRDLFARWFAIAIALTLPPASYAFRYAPQARERGSGSVYEGETLATSRKAIATGGRVTAQPMSGFGRGWSGDAQLLWGGSQTGATLDLILDVPARGVYSVDLLMTRAPDFGRVRFQIDGRDVAASFDGYAATVMPSGPVRAGNFDLAAGQHKVSLLIIGKNDKATGLLVGIDAIVLRRQDQTHVLGGPQTMTEPPINPARLGIRTTLEVWNGIGTVDHAALTYGTDATFDPSRTSFLWQFRWSTTVVGATSALLVASREAPSATDPPLAPAGLLGQKPVPNGVPPHGVTRGFSLDVGSWLLAAPGRGSLPPPEHVYMRIVLLDGNGQPVGPPSGVVTLTRGKRQRDNVLGEALKEQEKLEAESKEKAAKMSVYEVKILAHKPVTFPLDHRLGCVKVLKNKYVAILGHPLSTYPAGSEYCPQKDPQCYEKSTMDWVMTGFGGWLKAYDGLSHFYDGAKHYVASKFAEAVPCEWLGKKIESDCKKAAADIADAAMSAGLAAAGIPPTIPDLAALQDTAEGKIVDAAVDYSCKAIGSQGGQCTPEMRTALAKAYKAALDKLRADIKRQGREPDCKSQEIAKNCLIPLPCFTDYPDADVKPASGAIYEPSTVTVRITRVKPDPDFPMPACSVSAKMHLKNYFQGAMLGGIHAKPGPIEGDAFLPAQSTIPAIGLGKSLDVTIVFTEIRELNLPGIHDPTWGVVGWRHLYIGGKGSLYVSAGACGQGDKLDVEIPVIKSFN